MLMRISPVVKCAQMMGAVPRSARIIEYPLPDRPWDIVSIGLLTAPRQ